MDAAAQFAPDIADSIGTEQQKHDDQDDNRFNAAEVLAELRTIGQGATFQQVEGVRLLTLMIPRWASTVIFPYDASPKLGSQMLVCTAQQISFAPQGVDFHIEHLRSLQVLERPKLHHRILRGEVSIAYAGGCAVFFFSLFEPRQSVRQDDAQPFFDAPLVLGAQRLNLAPQVVQQREPDLDRACIREDIGGEVRADQLGVPITGQSGQGQVFGHDDTPVSDDGNRHEAAKREKAFFEAGAGIWENDPLCLNATGADVAQHQIRFQDGV